MQSIQREGLAVVTLASGEAGSPGSRVLEATTPASRRSDELIWVRLREAGLDEESVKKRDKAALIAYIAKLEAEIFEYQHQMGLLILERKDWTSKYEQLKSSSDSTEIARKLDQAGHLSALAEAKIREESLKKALGIEKECIANIEKTLHEMRAEYAETKIAADSKMAEACSMLENAQKKFAEAEAKVHAVESSQAEATRYHRAAERKLQEVEEREDELRRRLISFKSECEAEENKISIERQSLCERLKRVQQEQEKLLDGQARLNQREEYILGRSQELSRLEKELEASKVMLENEFKVLNEEKTNLEQSLAALSTREETVTKREALLEKKEQELVVGKEKLASREHDEIQRLMAKHEATLVMRKFELEAEMTEKLHSMEQEMESKRRVCELREVDLSQREELVQEKEHELELQSRMLLENEKDITERLKLLEDKETNLTAAEKAIELDKMHVQKDKEEIQKMKLDIEKSKDYLEKIRKEVEEAEEKLEASKIERNELLILEMKLKDEIDSIRLQKLDLMSEAEELNAQKSKFESEWELIDEKRDELRREAERISEERAAVSKFLKEERESLRLEKDALRNQFKHQVESLSQEREAFTSKMEQEHSKWFSKIQQERAILVQDMELQKRELESCIIKRREEIEGFLREKEEAFEQEKAKELQYISSLKEAVAEEQENILLEKKKLDNERVEIVLDRQRWEEELAELKKFIDELQSHREKLKEQRELLHEDREKINVQIQQLNHLEDLKTASENMALFEMQPENVKSTRQKLPAKKFLNSQTVAKDVEFNVPESNEASSDCLGPRLLSKKAQDSSSPHISTPFSWIKRCTEMIFKLSPDKFSNNHSEKSLMNELEGGELLDNKYSHIEKKVVLSQLKNTESTSEISEQQRSNGKDRTDKTVGEVQPMKLVTEEPKVILEVPSVAENAKSKCSLDSGPETDVNENLIYSHPEQGLLAGKKRENNCFSPDNSDSQLKQEQNYKKRRQHREASEVPSITITSNCGVSSQTIIVENESGLTTFNQTPIYPESGSFVEENTKNKSTEAAAQPDKMACSMRTSASDHDNLQGRGSDEQSYSLRASQSSKVELKLQEIHLGHDGNPENGCT